MQFQTRITNHPSILFDDVKVEEVETHKHLGVTFSKDLTWSNHIKNLLESSSKMLDIMRYFKYSLDRKTLETIYFTFVRPKLEYASPVWDDCNQREKDLLENFQLSAARIVTGAKKGTSHGLIYNEVCWPLLADRRMHCKLKMMHKIVHGTCPEYLTELLPNTVNSQHNLRDRTNIRQIKTRTEKFRKSFLPDGIRLWNELDHDIKSVADFCTFKDKLNTADPCNQIYYFGERKINIIHAQIRMKCSNLKHHLYLLHVENDPTCACSNAIEDSEHYFFNCQLYYTHRLKLFEILNAYNSFDLNTILFGNQALDKKVNYVITAAVHTFIKESGRF